MSAKITAIVPTYNRAAFLEAALAGLARQTRTPAEIIVWDDGSVDSTAEVARAASAPVRYFRGENAGKSAALNKAIAEATGDYIWICDDDDIALPHAAEALAALLDRNPALGASGGSYRRFRDDPGHQTGPGYWPDLTQGSVLRHLLEDIFLFQNATLVRRSCYDEVGGFREDLPRSIDYDMIVRLAVRFSIAVDEQPMFLQRKHDGDRGPAAARHSVARSDEVWMAADRNVFARFRQTVPIGVYAGMFRGEPEAVRRAALLQRACVYARKTDFAAALDDFTAAAAICPDVPLNDVEAAICRRSMAGKHGISAATRPPTVRALSDLARGSTVGAGIARALRRGLRWRLRAAVANRQVAETVGILRLGASLSPRARAIPTVSLMSVDERAEPVLVAS